MGKKEKEELKLYVWTDFCSDYTPGLAFAVARNEEEAKKAVGRAYYYPSAGYWGELHVHKLPRKTALAYAVSGGS